MSKDDEPEELDEGDELDKSDRITHEDPFPDMRARREDQREQVSYDWCMTVRDAGEQYRDKEDIQAVANVLSISLDDTRQALTVYRLLFEEPLGTVAMNTSRAGRAFFTVNKDMEEVINTGEGFEPDEHRIREFVGAIHLAYDIDEESVGEPVERETPESPSDIEDLREALTQGLSFPSKEFTPASRITQLNKTLSQEIGMPGIRGMSRMSGVTNPLLAQMVLPSELKLQMIGQMASPSTELFFPKFDQLYDQMYVSQIETLRTALEAMGSPKMMFQPLIDEIAGQNHAFAATRLESITNSLEDILFPESIVADLTTIQPSIAAAALPTLSVMEYSTASPFAGSVPEPSTSTLSTESVEPSITPESFSVDTPVEPSIEPPTVDSPAASTVDATLPEPDMVSTELMFKIPAMLVETMLSRGEAWEWFESRPKEYQIMTVGLLMTIVAWQLMDYPIKKTIIPLSAPAVWRFIIDQKEREK